MAGIENQKRLILEHVLYEIEMYLWIDDYMISHSKNNYDLFPSQMLKNIFLESYYIHIRNLLFFFSNDKPQDDDIIYLDLLNNSCNSKGLYFNKGEWYELRKLINHASVHLTKKRQTENIKNRTSTKIL